MPIDVWWTTIDSSTDEAAKELGNSARDRFVDIAGTAVSDARDPCDATGCRRAGPFPAREYLLRYSEAYFSERVRVPVPESDRWTDLMEKERDRGLRTRPRCNAVSHLRQRRSESALRVRHCTACRHWAIIMNPSADMIDCRLSERSGRRHFFIPRGAENRRPLLPLVDRAAA